MVAIEGVPLHSPYFAKLWYEIYQSEVSLYYRLSFYFFFGMRLHDMKSHKTKLLKMFALFKGFPDF